MNKKPTPRERFLNAINFQKPVDRLPMIEWADWWDKTYHRWQIDGLPEDLTRENLVSYFGLDEMACIIAITRGGGLPAPAYHGAPIIDAGNLNTSVETSNKASIETLNKASIEASYEAIRPMLFTDDCLRWTIEQGKRLAGNHKEGNIIVRLWLDGFFWFPRSLFGIENHLYAFYDYPELLHRMCRDLADYNRRVMDALFEIIEPDMVGFAEDMSYNHGPMLSHEQFREFLLPYYKELVPYINQHNITAWVDTDGDVVPLIPWLLEAGIQGIYPLERQAGVDVSEIRRRYPKLLMMGAFDKMVMSKGENEIRAEFERLLPVMRSGGFIVSMDHQTPPETPLENYRIYLAIYEEYCRHAVSS